MKPGSYLAIELAKGKKAKERNFQEGLLVQKAAAKTNEQVQRNGSLQHMPGERVLFSLQVRNAGSPNSACIIYISKPCVLNNICMKSMSLTKSYSSSPIKSSSGSDILD